MHTMDKKNEEEKVDPKKTSCGWGSCHPGFLQVFNNPGALLFGLTWFCIIQGFVVNGIIKTNTTSLERRFNLQSVSAGFIPSAYDVAAALVGVPVSYIGIAGHKPRILSVMALIMAAGSFLSVIPHFTTGAYEITGGATSELCNGNATICTQKNDLSNYVFVFIAGNFLHGVGGAALYTLGAPLLDDNVPNQKSPIYVGIMYAGSALGPALGYIIGGQLLNIYVDVDKTNGKSVPFTPSDSRWVGAWWIGYLISGTLFLTCFLWFSFFGRETPAAEEARKTRVSQACKSKSSEKAENAEFGKSIRDFPVALKIVMSNPIFVLLSFAGVVEAIAISGFSTFIPKFMQNQFGLTAGTGAMLAGLAVVPGAAGGHILSGLILRKFRLKAKGVITYCSIMSLLGCLFGLVLLARCNSPDFAGINKNYMNSTLQNNGINLLSPCNQPCNCTTSNYDPVCGVDKIQYFSACHAGCVTSSTVNGKLVSNRLTSTGPHAKYFSALLKRYSNCTCISSTGLKNTTSFEAESGVCGVSCNMVPLFMPFFFLLILATFMSTNGGLNATLRIIPETQRTFAFGMQYLLLRIFGTVPGPLVMGAIFDVSCLVWQDKCGSRGSCWIYDSARVGVALAVICVIVKGLSFIFFMLARCLYQPPKEEIVMSLKEINESAKTDIAYVHTSTSALQDEKTSL